MGKNLLFGDIFFGFEVQGTGLNVDLFIRNQNVNILPCTLNPVP